MYYPAGGYLALYFELFGLPVGGSGFIDTASRRRTGASTADVLIEALGEGIKIGIGHDAAFVSVDATSWQGRRRSLGKSYADLRPYASLTSPSIGSTTYDEETALLEHYFASLKGDG